MPDFKKALIYKICKTINEKTYCYVGSTTNFTNRKYQHNKNSQDNNSLLYKTIRDHGGFNTWTIEKIKDFPCENKIDLRIEEDKCIKELGGNLNINRAYLTKEEVKLKNLEQHKKRYHNDSDFRKKTLEYCKHKYATDEDYKATQLQNANRRYNTNLEYRNKTIERAKQRYLAKKLAAIE
jgi:hypothetical protein